MLVMERETWRDRGNPPWLDIQGPTGSIPLMHPHHPYSLGAYTGGTFLSAWRAHKL